MPFTYITRSMIIVKSGDEVAVLNTVRLDSAGEAALDKLGRVSHIVNLTANHGCDDPYFVHKYPSAQVR
jgi:hypothetical protein